MESFEEKLINLNKEEKPGKEEIPLLRRELVRVQEKTKEECEKDEKSGFFHGAEILNVNLNELNDDDLFLYKDLKEFMRTKMSFEEFFKELSLHRLLVGEHIADRLKKVPNFDFKKDSRVIYSAWAVNRALDAYYKQRVRTREKNKKVA